MYLHTILSRPESDLTKQVYNVQKTIYTKDDWYRIVMNDRSELNISHTDQEISNMSKDKFRILVSIAIEEKALSYLNEMAAGHSKSTKLVKTKFQREQYFEDPKFSKSETELLFALRTRTIRSIKKNFPTQFSNNLTCQLCFLHVDCQEDLLTCSELIKRVKIPTDVKYSDIYKSTDKQIKIVKVMKQLLRTREVLLQ